MNEHQKPWRKLGLLCFSALLLAAWSLMFRNCTLAASAHGAGGRMHRISMHGVQIISEEECSRGWRYIVRLEREDGSSSEHHVRLDWAEHELWCGGRCPPSRVVEVLVLFLLDHEGQREIPDRFDAATVRRWWPEVDDIMPGRL